ncbi:MAG: hypothetical protein WCT39_01595 [Candidatus Margulisiibacteriota bacterium]
MAITSVKQHMKQIRFGNSAARINFFTLTDTSGQKIKARYTSPDRYGKVKFGFVISDQIYIDLCAQKMFTVGSSRKRNLQLRDPAIHSLHLSFICRDSHILVIPYGPVFIENTENAETTYRNSPPLALAALSQPCKFNTNVILYIPMEQPEAQEARFLKISLLLQAMPPGTKETTALAPIVPHHISIQTLPPEQITDPTVSKNDPGHAYFSLLKLELVKTPEEAIIIFNQHMKKLIRKRELLRGIANRYLGFGLYVVSTMGFAGYSIFFHYIGDLLVAAGYALSSLIPVVLGRLTGEALIRLDEIGLIE